MSADLTTVNLDDLIQIRRLIDDLIPRLNRVPGLVLRHKPAGRRGPPHGYKVAPKFRDPTSGKTWAGRGNRPKWVKEKHRIHA